MSVITSLNSYAAATKQIVAQKKTASITTVALQISSPFALAGLPGAGVLAGTNATTGILQTDAVAGYPAINTLGAGDIGNITRLNGYCSVAGTLILVDTLLKLGTIAFGATASALTTVDISGRVPDNGYGGLELWIEAVTAYTGNVSMAVTYIDGDDQARTTGTVSTGAALIVGRCFRMPLAAAGRGIKSITGFTSSIASAGTCNLLIVRPIQRMRIPFAGYSENRTWDQCGAPKIYGTSALAVFMQQDSTALGLPEWEIEISNV
jgi:hypothetical protein